MTGHMTAVADALSARAAESRDVQMDRAELARAIEDLHSASFAWALGCCRRQRDEAEEVLQNVYVMVLEGKARFEGRSSLKTWLFGVIRRVSLAHARRKWLHEALLMKWARSRDGHVDDRSADVERCETASRLVAALRQLPQRQREVVELVFYHEMTVDQAASVMRVGVGSARTHYERAKKRLRLLLAEGDR